MRPPAGREWRARGPLLVATGLLSAAVLGCTEGAAVPETIAERGFIRAGYTDEPPYAYRDSMGRVTGGGPEVLRAAAAAAGLPDVHWVRLDFDALIPALRQGRIDVIAAGMHATEARRRLVRFSRPTVCGRPALVVASDATELPDLEDLREGRARLAAISGSIEASALARLDVPESQIVVVPDVTTGAVAVREGEVDGLAVTAPTGRHLAARTTGTGDGLEVVHYTPPTEIAPLLQGCSALAFRSGDDELRAAIDGVLPEVLRSREYRNRLEDLGFSAADLSAASSRPGAER